MNPLTGIVLVLGLLGGFIVLVKFAQKKWALNSERSRKAVHVGMGLLCLCFPWIFQSTLPVAILAVLAVLALMSLRMTGVMKDRFGAVLNGVERQSWGEICFPVAVAILFYLTPHQKLVYEIAVLTLTLADATGALVGVRYGTVKYTTDEGVKSIEGSLTFFVVAFFSVHVPLLLFSQIGRSETLLVALIVGFLIMLLEAISWRGLDNLIVPVGVFFLLRDYLKMNTNTLLVHFSVILMFVIFVFVTRKRTTLNDSALLAAALSGYGIWALGDWSWLLAPLVLFVFYLILPGFNAASRPTQSLHAVTRVMAGAFAWLLLTRMKLGHDFFVPYLFCLACHLGNIISARFHLLYPERSSRILSLQAWAISVGAFVPTLLITRNVHPISWLAMSLLCVSVAISVLAFHRFCPRIFTPSDLVRLWFSESIIAFLASLLGIFAI